MPRTRAYMAPLLKFCQHGSVEEEIILEPVPSDSEQQPVSLLEQLANLSSDETNQLNPRQLFTDSPQANKPHSINFDNLINKTF